MIMMSNKIFFHVLNYMSESERMLSEFILSHWHELWSEWMIWKQIKE